MQIMQLHRIAWRRNYSRVQVKVTFHPGMRHYVCMLLPLDTKMRNSCNHFIESRKRIRTIRTTYPDKRTNIVCTLREALALTRSSDGCILFSCQIIIGRNFIGAVSRAPDSEVLYITEFSWRTHVPLTESS